MFATVYFIHVRMDKHMQATEKNPSICAGMYVYGLCSNGKLLFLYYFQMYMPVHITNIHANTVMGLFYLNELRSKGGLPNNWNFIKIKEKSCSMTIYEFPSLNFTVLKDGVSLTKFDFSVSSGSKKNMTHLSYW